MWILLFVVLFVIVGVILLLRLAASAEKDESIENDVDDFVLHDIVNDEDEYDVGT